MKVSITYVGEAGSNIWGGVDRLPEVAFEKNKPVTIDTANVPGNQKGFYEHLVKKARTNRFFEVREMTSAGGAATEKKTAGQKAAVKKQRTSRAGDG